MTSKRTRSTGRAARIAAALVAFALAIPGLGAAHITNSENGFFDSYETLGNLAGSQTTDPYEIKSGTWRITDVPTTAGVAALGTSRVLQQDSRATNVTSDPMVFVRDLKFRSFTAQVTAAYLDALSTGDPAPGAGVGLVFRAPVSDGLADRDNLYLFSSVVTGIATGFPTGKGLVLFKRVGRTYYLLSSQVIPTWVDLLRPHDYKVVMTSGHIMAYFDGRLVIEHTDIPSGDLPTTTDPLPGLPFDSGAVGLRTSGARAWFDNFSVVGNDGYEGRANAFDVYASYGQRSTNTAADVRRGVVPQSSNLLNSLGSNKLDTGFVYHDHDDFNDAAVRPVDNPGNGGPLAGAEVSTVGSDGSVISTARLLGVNISAIDPTQRLKVTFTASSVETIARASCTGTSSVMNMVAGMLTVEIVNTGDGSSQVIGPFPIQDSYGPNSVIRDQPGLITIVAHYRKASTLPQRVEAAALRIVMPESSQGVGAMDAGGQRTPSAGTQTPAAEVLVADVVAGRYC